jgi:hypothetical protein
VIIVTKTVSYSRDRDVKRLTIYSSFSILTVSKVAREELGCGAVWGMPGLHSQRDVSG